MYCRTVFVLNDFAGGSIVMPLSGANVPHLRFWRGDYLNCEFKRGKQVDEFVECEFVDVGLK